MNVWNAVPLRTTASISATAFSIIMFMDGFPVLLWLGARALPRGGEGKAPGLGFDIHSSAQFSISA
ncbi:hypothetical protein [Erythrobacter sp. WG]|uniref:hypothetical protein n=1 Tax=Erythrobacter sp. WG TaxID=2985510 RepID=UPI0022718122|nr:hypothetical protein [Erythrobacter sp. WG]MCX9148628.1 hypothetical protein [Erythrobacter sp. WG]